MSQRPNYPYGRDFQVRLVAMMAREPSFMPSYAEVLRPEYIGDECLSILSRILLDTYHETGRIPPSEVVNVGVVEHVNHMKADAPMRGALVNAFHEIYDVSYTDSADVIKNRAAEFGKNRQLSDLVRMTSEKLANGDPSDEIWELYDRFRQQGSANGSEVVNLGKKLFGAVDIIRSSSIYSVQKKVPSGIPSLDRALNGGFSRKTVTTVLGFTNRGKSTILSNFGFTALLERVPVAHFAIGEMYEEDILAKYSARATGIDVNQITGMDDIHAVFRSSMAARFKEDDPPNLFYKYFYPHTSVSHLKSAIARIKFRDGISPGLLLVDNGDYLSSSKGADDMYREQGYVQEELGALAYDLDLAIVVDTQTNRSGGKAHQLDMEYTGESHGKNKSTSAMIAINQTEQEKFLGILRLGLIKGRRNETSSQICWCEFNRPTMTITEIPASDPRVTGLTSMAAIEPAAQIMQ